MSLSDTTAPPALCSTCLGPSTHLRLIRERNALECKLCTRPFTVYRWTSATDKHSRKHTTICLTCARQRNCCQCCLLDLTYGISIQLRDAALKMAGINVGGGEKTNLVSKLYVADNEAKFDKLGGAKHTSDAEKAKEILTKLALSLKGKEEEKQQKQKKEKALPEHLQSVDITKILSKLPLNGSLSIPKDETLKSFFVFGIDESMPEYKITDFFEKYAPVKAINCQHDAKCAYVTFAERTGAEVAAKGIMGQSGNNESRPAFFVVDNIPMRCCWGKERPLGSTYGERVKLGSVVAKVMKKLAKEENPKDTKKRKVESHEDIKVKKKKDSELTEKPVYKSLAKDFEL